MDIILAMPKSVIFTSPLCKIMMLHPSLRITIGDSDILDGDYVSSTPKIKVELDDFTLLPITDSTSIIMTLNDSLISNLNNPFVKVYLNPANPKMAIEYTPDRKSTRLNS